MRVNSMLLSAFAAPLLLLLRDGELACAIALSAEQSSFNESTPDYRRMHHASPAASGPTASIPESHVSEMNKIVRKGTRSEDRMENKFAEVLESSALALTDMASKVEPFGREEMLPKTMVQPISTSSYALTTQKTRVYEDFARGEQPMDATKFATLLLSNDALGSTAMRAKPYAIVKALLSKRNPLEVTRLVVSLRSIPGMTTASDTLHRQLVAFHKDIPKVMSDAWMGLGLDPRELFEVLGWRRNRPGRKTLAFLHEWVLYIIRFKRVHSATLGIDEAFSLLFPNQNPGQVYAYLGRLKKKRGLEVLAQTLWGLFAEVRQLFSPMNKMKAQRLLFREVQLKNTPFHVRAFAELATPSGPMNAPAFAHLLKNVPRMRPKDLYARLVEIVGTLLFSRPPAEVVQVLASLHKIPGNEFTATEMHRILASHYLPGQMRYVWMEAGLHPMIIQESCIGGRYVPYNLFNDALETELREYSKLFGGVHPYAYSTHDANEFLLHNN